MSTPALRKLHPLFACEVEQADLDDAAYIVKIMDEYAVAVLRDQRMSDEEQIAFCRRFGELELSPHFGVGKGGKVRMRHPELFDVSNLDEEGNLLAEDDRRRMFRLANEMWHTDSSFVPGGARYSMLRALVVPSRGADTEFADMRAAYDALSEEKKRQLEGLVVEHSTFYSRSLIGFQFTPEELTRRTATPQYLVQRHPSSGRKALYLASHASHVVGWSVDKGRALLAELTAHATQPQFVYVHKWRVGDLVIWDNRCTMHRATPFPDTNERRDLRRTTVRGDLPHVHPG
ncbi:MAG TPA: TauD/TfdA family dioxygenase [Burkholderiales bacterium]|nr:TauD/TfdA family dioxygenase [Burkholderiales bacterium]